MTLPALYHLATEYREAAETLADMDLDPQTIADTLESLSGDVEVKAQNVAYMVGNLEATADAIKAHREHQKQREDAIRNRAESLRRYLQSCMEMTGISKIEGAGISIGFRKSTAVAIDEPGLVPIEYMRFPEPPPPAPDKAEIAKALKSGKEVPGAHLEHRQTLQIK